LSWRFLYFLSWAWRRMGAGFFMAFADDVLFLWGYCVGSVYEYSGILKAGETRYTVILYFYSFAEQNDSLESIWSLSTITTTFGAPNSAQNDSPPVFLRSQPILSRNLF
jgi:hypothetical protein